MKKLIVALGLVMFMATSSFGAAQLALTKYSSTGDEVVDSQYTGTWEQIDSLILARTGDASVAIIRYTGWAVMDAGDALYIAFGNTYQTKTSINLDTTRIVIPKSVTGKMYVPFCAEYISNVTAANTDTFYVNAAVGGSTEWEKVELYDTYMTATITAP